MNDVTFRIPISTRGGLKTIEVYARSEDAELVCHPVDDDVIDDEAWTITHRHTGSSVRPSRVYCKDAALALIDIYTPLGDWSEIRVNCIGDPVEFKDMEKAKRLRSAIEDAYERFEWHPPEVTEPETSVTKGGMTMPNRRSRMDQWSPAERAIYDAAQMVETMGADLRLTKALNLLSMARNTVADFVDGVDDVRTSMILSEVSPSSAE